MLLAWLPAQQACVKLYPHTCVPYHHPPHFHSTRPHPTRISRQPARTLPYSVPTPFPTLFPSNSAPPSCQHTPPPAPSFNHSSHPFSQTPFFSESAPRPPGPINKHMPALPAFSLPLISSPAPQKLSESAWSSKGPCPASLLCSRFFCQRLASDQACPSPAKGQLIALLLFAAPAHHQLLSALHILPHSWAPRVVPRSTCMQTSVDMCDTHVAITVKSRRTQSPQVCVGDMQARCGQEPQQGVGSSVQGFGKTVPEVVKAANQASKKGTHKNVKFVQGWKGSRREVEACSTCSRAEWGSRLSL